MVGHCKHRYEGLNDALAPSLPIRTVCAFAGEELVIVESTFLYCTQSVFHAFAFVLNAAACSHPNATVTTLELIAGFGFSFLLGFDMAEAADVGPLGVVSVISADLRLCWLAGEDVWRRLTQDAPQCDEHARLVVS